MKKKNKNMKKKNKKSKKKDKSIKKKDEKKDKSIKKEKSTTKKMKSNSKKKKKKKGKGGSRRYLEHLQLEKPQRGMIMKGAGDGDIPSGFENDYLYDDFEDSHREQMVNRDSEDYSDEGDMEENGDSRDSLEEAVMHNDFPSHHDHGKTTCHTAYAYHSRRISTQFQDMGFSSTKYNWGWSNGPLAHSTFAYSFELYTNDRKTVGTVSMDYNGVEATVTIDAVPHFWFDNVYAYVGSHRLPDMDGVDVIDPHKFPVSSSNKKGEAHGGTDIFTKGSFTFSVSGFENEPIYVAVYASVCRRALPMEGPFSGMQLTESEFHNIRGGLADKPTNNANEDAHPVLTAAFRKFLVRETTTDDGGPK